MSRLNRLSRFRGECHHIVIPFVVLLYALSHPPVFIVAGFLLWRLLRYDMLYFVLSLGAFMVASIVLTVPEASDHGPIKTEGIISEIDVNREFPRMRLKTQTGDYIVYEETLSYRVGDCVRIQGEQTQVLPNGYFGGFDYQAYLRSIRIEGIIHADTHSPCAEQAFNVYRVRAFFHDYIDNTFENSDYLKAFILASRESLDETVYESYQSLGIAHLFAVSGLHVGFMALALNKALGVFSEKRGFKDVAIGLFLLGYLFVTGFPPSVMRASLMVCLLGVNHHLKLRFTPLDIVMMLCAGLLVIHPHYLNQSGFVLSFLVSITLILSRDFLEGRSVMAQSVIVSLVSFIISAPIILSMQGQINLMSIVFNVFYVFLMTLVVLPLTYAVFFMPFLDSVFSVVIGFFEGSVRLMLDHFSWFLTFHIHEGLVSVAYVCLAYRMFAVFKTTAILRVRAGVFLGFVTLVYASAWLSPAKSLTMFDVAGDAFLLRDANNRCNILIDTGEPDPHDNLVRALRRRNIRRLDYVLITHQHLDHYGAYDSIDANFTIGEVITNHDQVTHEGQWLSCGNIDFFIFPNDLSYGSENDNSMVKLVRFMDRDILFTGDIEQTREAAFAKRYAFDIDILKVAHHGSISSSNEWFLDLYEPHTALIPARRNNRFDHPSETVVERLEARDIVVYRLDEHGSVEFSKIGPLRFKKTALNP